MSEFTAHKKAQIDLAAKYDEGIAISLPFAWNWDKRYIDSLPYTFSFSVAATALDCSVGDIILDFACGSGWVSEWLNRLGFRTVATDISPDLLRFAKKRMTCDSRINLDLFPAQFVESDGEHLPFPDETFDGIMCMNSLHHFADYQIVLDEMYRVLKKDGRASFSEPGIGHSQAPLSRKEMLESGVLERDVILSEVHKMALKSGFQKMLVTPVVVPQAISFTMDERQDFMKGKSKVVNRYLQEVRSYIEHNGLFFCLHKGDRQMDSRRPHALKAEMHTVDMTSVAHPETTVRAKLVVKNTGDTLWLAESNAWGGFVTLGIKLQGVDGHDNEYGRALLSKNVAPGQTITIEAIMKTPSEKGKYIVKFDMVCEGHTWFEHAGSAPVLAGLEVK